MQINIPAVRAELSVAFWRYTNALLAHDTDTIIALFWSSDHALRYGITENHYGIEAIATFRRGRRPPPTRLAVTRVVVTSFGTDFGTANSELRDDTGEQTTRMSHTWVRFAEGWRIVAAHVSLGPAP